MPTFPGPWQAGPGPLTIAGPPGVAFGNYTVISSPGPFADICEPTPTDSGLVPADIAGFAIENASGTSFSLTQIAVDYLVDAVTFHLATAWAPPLPWPAHAIDWEWDLAASVLTWITGLVASVELESEPGDPATAAVTLDAVPADPATFILSGAPYTGNPRTRPIPGADLSPIVDSVDVPVGPASVTITTSVIGREFIGNIDSPTAESDYLPVKLVIAFDNQVTHVPPGVNTSRRLRLTVPSAPSSVLHFTPSRWRFLFDRTARLRQYPRDDELGGVPRQGGLSRSVQASPRQGWTGAYR